MSCQAWGHPVQCPTPWAHHSSVRSIFAEGFTVIAQELAISNMVPKGNMLPKFELKHLNKSASVFCFWKKVYTTPKNTKKQSLGKWLAQPLVILRKLLALSKPAANPRREPCESRLESYCSQKAKTKARTNPESKAKPAAKSPKQSLQWSPKQNPLRSPKPTAKAKAKVQGPNQSLKQRPKLKAKPKSNMDRLGRSTVFASEVCQQTHLVNKHGKSR